MALTDYKRIEYIEAQKIGSIASYIDLGVKPTRYWSIFGNFAFKISTLTDNAYLFGLYDGTRNYSNYYNYSSQEYRFRYATRSATALTPANTYFGDDEIATSGFSISIAQTQCDGFMYNDNEYLGAYVTIPGSAATATKNLYLLGRNNNGTADGFATGSRCYEFNIFDVNNNDENLMHLLPVREKTGLTPKVGMYDIINNTVYWSNTSTNFIAGPDLSAANIYIKAGGSWYSGTPYIKVNGSWEEASDVYIKASGSWESSV